MFDEFKNVPEHVKTETIEFSLSNVQICIRYTPSYSGCCCPSTVYLPSDQTHNSSPPRSYLRANKDKPTLIDQQIAAGTYNQAFQTAYDKVYPDDRYWANLIPPLTRIIQVSCSEL